jgi:hypothetical protein
MKTHALSKRDVCITVGLISSQGSLSWLYCPFSDGDPKNQIVRATREKRDIRDAREKRTGWIFERLRCRIDRHLPYRIA